MCIEVLIADLAVEHAARTVREHTDALGLHIDLLVNNAGFATAGRFEQLDPVTDHAQVMLNVVTVVDLAHQYLPAMADRGHGAVINVASIGGFQPAPYLAVYSASKAFVLTFSQALWGEYRSRGIQVLALCPGPVDTGFFDIPAVARLPSANECPSTRWSVRRSSPCAPVTATPCPAGATAS